MMNQVPALTQVLQAVLGVVDQATGRMDYVPFTSMAPDMQMSVVNQFLGQMQLQQQQQRPAAPLHSKGSTGKSQTGQKHPQMMSGQGFMQAFMGPDGQIMMAPYNAQHAASRS